MSCSPVERPVGPRIGIDLFLRELATRSGAAMLRVEKPGLGDREGPPCRDVDFRSELDAHRAAFRAFRARPDVDPERIAVVAQSNGAAYAPLVVEDAEVAEFYTEFLIRNRMPGDILRDRPHLEEIRAWGERHQYGLPAAYLQQLQALNLEEVWRRVDVPTLVF